VPKDVYELAALGCNDREIARWFDLDENTLRYNFSDIMEKGRDDLKHSLRRAMIKNALGGNAVMQIWLSKQWLGFSDQPTNTEANTPLPWCDTE
jgi:DNA-binding CsgD family transcriptional regulator